MLLAKQLMWSKGWSKAKLARIADLNQATVGKVVEGKAAPFPGQAKKIAAALEWDGDLDRLFQEVDA